MLIGFFRVLIFLAARIVLQTVILAIKNIVKTDGNPGGGSESK